jgi:hypothetical protein
MTTEAALARSGEGRGTRLESTACGYASCIDGLGALWRDLIESHPTPGSSDCLAGKLVDSFEKTIRAGISQSTDQGRWVLP